MLHAFTSSHGGGCNGCRFFVCFWKNRWACNKSLILKSRLVWEFRWSIHLVYIWFHHGRKKRLYNTEKNSSFVDVFWKKIYKLFYKNKNPHRFYRWGFITRNQLMKYYNEKYGKWIKLYSKIKEWYLLFLLFR